MKNKPIGGIGVWKTMRYCYETITILVILGQKTKGEGQSKQTGLRLFMISCLILLYSIIYNKMLPFFNCLIYLFLIQQLFLHHLLYKYELLMYLLHHNLLNYMYYEISQFHLH